MEVHKKRGYQETSPDQSASIVAKKQLINSTTMSFSTPNHNQANNITQAALSLPAPSNDLFSWSVFDSKLSAALDLKLHDVARKDDLQPLRMEIQHLRSENTQLKEELQAMKNRLELIDKSSRRANIVVSGLSNRNTQSAVAEFNDLCFNVLNTTAIVKESRPVYGGKLFVFSLDSALQVNSIIAAKKNLKGTNIFVQKDYTADERNKRFQLRTLGKNIAKAGGQIKVRFGEFCIYVNDIQFTWNNGKVEGAKIQDVEFLRGIVTKAKFSYDIIVRETPKSNDKVPALQVSSSDQLKN